MATTVFHRVQDEELVKAISTHWIKYVGPTLVSGLFIITGILMLSIAALVKEAASVVSMILLFFGLILTHIATHRLFHKLLSEAMEDIVVTTRRVIWLRKSLFQYDDMHQIPIENIQGVEARKHGVLQTVLGYGTIWFDTGGTETESSTTIYQVPHPNRLARDINRLLHLK